MFNGCKGRENMIHSKCFMKKISKKMHLKKLKG
nr:MAG TPA: hypothetical protein [Caudoviricetes sp.]